MEQIYETIGCCRRGRRKFGVEYEIPGCDRFGPRHADHRPVLTLDMDGVNTRPGRVKGGR